MTDSRMMEPVPSDRESSHFGLAIGRLAVDNSEQFRSAEDAVLSNRFDLVIVRMECQPSKKIDTRTAMFDCGAVVTYEGCTTPTKSRSVPALDDRGLRLTPIRQWSHADTTLVETIFAGYRNHIAANPHLDASRVPAGYADWSERHVHEWADGACHRLEDADGSAVAFAAVSHAGDALVIDLAGVLPSRRRQGNYQQLLGHLEREAAALGLARVRISTQAANAVAIHAWRRRGWEQVACSWIVHVMRSE